jgi:hypothetical protein
VVKNTVIVPVGAGRPCCKRLPGQRSDAWLAEGVALQALHASLLDVTDNIVAVSHARHGSCATTARPYLVVAFGREPRPSPASPTRSLPRQKFWLRMPLPQRTSQLRPQAWASRPAARGSARQR